ncbi:hypothetical protein, partial [Salmonella enterica]|uniref:hypothetical protein n=1 Tax=Salmonella enterica TaxID=28901 RepID=UPI001A931A06
FFKDTATSVGDTMAYTLSIRDAIPIAFDLHVLGLTTAFNLSHDQTLKCKSLMLKELNVVMN